MAHFDSNAGKTEGIEYWRVEQLKPVRQKDEDLGDLFDGDCYIFLHTKKKGGGFEWDLFFWLGGKSSQDEQGGAALLSVELDDQLGGAPVQYRETQGHESEKFKSIFPDKTIMIHAGGVDSAFNKVERDKYESRLFHLKGKRTVQVCEVDKKCSSMNDGDVFILDKGLDLFQWNGKEANKYEKFKGLELINKINSDERGGRCKLHFLDSGKNDEEHKDFWGELEGSRSDFAAITDDKEVKPKPAKPALIKVSDASGSVETTVVQDDGNLHYENLDETEVFIVDIVTAIYIWVGKGASKEENRNAMKMAMDYIKQKGYATHVQVSKLNQGHESDQFKAKFTDWPSASQTGRQSMVDALYASRKKNEEHLAEMEGEIVNIWRIKDMAKEPLDKSVWGQFWAGDCFILLYKYKINPSKDGHFIYFWLGRDCSIDERGAAALLAKDLDDEMGGDPVQIRVVMGKEPAHFLTLFKGRMIVHHGGVASGFKSVKDSDTFDTDGISLFHVRGNNQYNTRAVQVEEKASSLNSGDCFVLLTPKTMYCWHGDYANDDEKKTADSIADVMKGDRTKEIVDEGKEADTFWESIGGKGEYAKSKPASDEAHDPRLFHMTCNVGYFSVTEVFDYDQSDLVPDDVMMLDCFNEVYLWVGDQATMQEKDNALLQALEYVKTVNDGRDEDTPVYRVSAGYEPPNFTQHFLGWDSSKSLCGEDPYLALLKKQGISVETGEQGQVRLSELNTGFLPFPPSGKAYTLAELQAGTPEGCDPQQKEMYLSDDEFQATFGKSKEDFAGLPKWKKQGAKKQKKLF